MAIRQQLSSMLFVRKICEAQITKLKTGDIDASVLHQVGYLPFCSMIYTTYCFLGLLYRILSFYLFCYRSCIVYS